MSFAHGGTAWNAPSQTGLWASQLASSIIKVEVAYFPLEQQQMTLDVEVNALEKWGLSDALDPSSVEAHACFVWSCQEGLLENHALKIHLAMSWSSLVPRTHLRHVACMVLLAYVLMQCEQASALRKHLIAFLSGKWHMLHGLSLARLPLMPALAVKCHDVWNIYWNLGQDCLLWFSKSRLLHMYAGKLHDD